MALLIVAIIAAYVKLITIVCEYTSPSSCCVQYLVYLEVAILAKQLSLLLYSHNLVYTYISCNHSPLTVHGYHTDSTVVLYHAS